MGITKTVDGELSASKMRRRGPSTMEFLDADILCTIFSFLHLFDLVHCSVVCRSWNTVIKRLKLLQASCLKMQQLVSGTSTSLDPSAEIDLEDFAMNHHRTSLIRGRIHIDRWKGHSDRVSQCRMKKGLVLTGVGDKVIRLWSLNNYRCMEEYSLPGASSLVDFDFDESKIVGLVGTRISIWRRNGQNSIFPSREGLFPKGLCMRYGDPEAVVGCEDGTARVFDMYSKTCSRIIRVTVSDPLADQPVATLKSMISTGGIKTLCFNPCSYMAFTGTTAGYVSCWDLRKMGQLWERRVSPNVVYSIEHLKKDTSVLVAGGIDGVLRVMDQETGGVLLSCVMDDKGTRSMPGDGQVVLEKRRGRRLSEDVQIDKVDRNARPPVTCLAVGMKKVVTTHNDKYISLWKFNVFP
ncbi:PREDICTED: F-box/WD-40 repeat-containing protein At3g52030 isoform X2 [Tarenaya hassleriana]|uniref:F-box/WD-40 repeat-containing protein At3g52030 isoform X2 n=1 Tax=Tarenaya hassleriana TaxID=28532 RepID=UPI00053C8CD5|nr:PREDICTED: F-box/WD-40 repeat-containing protein At3g52030 isoform X2 [Tarenaya hassleriana]